MRIGRDLPAGAQNPSSRTAFLHVPPRPSVAPEGMLAVARAVPMLPPQRLAILGCDDAGIGPRERYLPGPPLSHADGKHVAADPLRAAAAARAHVEAFAGAIVVHFDVDAVDSAGLPLANYPHHGEGLTLGTAVTVPPELGASPAVICLVLTEVSPYPRPRRRVARPLHRRGHPALAESSRPKEVAGLTRALPSASPDHRGGRQSHFWC